MPFALDCPRSDDESFRSTNRRMFWSRHDKKLQRSERKPANGLRLSSAIDHQLPETPSLDGYRVEILTPEQARQALEALVRSRRR